MNLTRKTGDVELDVAARIVALGVTGAVVAGPGRNLWTSSEQPPDGERGAVGTFIELSMGRNGGTNDSVLREFDVQILHRFVPGPQKREERAARDRMLAIYEALHRSGEFIGKDSKGRYVEVIAIDVPVLLEPRYWVCNFTLYRDADD